LKRVPHSPGPSAPQHGAGWYSREAFHPNWIWSARSPHLSAGSGGGTRSVGHPAGALQRNLWRHREENRGTAAFEESAYLRLRFLARNRSTAAGNSLRAYQNGVPPQANSGVSAECNSKLHWLATR